MIKILVYKKYFTESAYNAALSKLNFKNYDAPEKISMKSNKMKGKAMSILSHLRYFGLILKKIPNLDEGVVNDDAFILAIELSRMCERLMAPSIREYEIDLLEEDVVLYLDKRAALFKEYPRFMNNPKPKHHFCSHYTFQTIKYEAS